MMRTLIAIYIQIDLHEICFLINIAVFSSILVRLENFEVKLQNSRLNQQLSLLSIMDDINQHFEQLRRLLVKLNYPHSVDKDRFPEHSLHHIHSLHTIYLPGSRLDQYVGSVQE